MQNQLNNGGKRKGGGVWQCGVPHVFRGGGRLSRAELRTDTAIVWALRTRETALWPLVWFVIGIEESVLLLKTEPWLDLKNLVHDLLGVVAVVGLVGGSVVVVGLGKDEDVVATTERILEDGGGAKVDVRVAAGCLVCRGAVEIPNTEITNVLDGLRDGLWGTKMSETDYKKG